MDNLLRGRMYQMRWKIAVGSKSFIISTDAKWLVTTNISANILPMSRGNFNPQIYHEHFANGEQLRKLFECLKKTLLQTAPCFQQFHVPCLYLFHWKNSAFLVNRENLTTVRMAFFISPPNLAAGLVTRGTSHRRVSPYFIKMRSSSPPSSPRTPSSSDRHPANKKDWGPFELAWRLQTMRNHTPNTCPTCRGSGEVECPVCHATGVLTLGDTLVCSIEGGDRCPVCKDGVLLCRKCKGSGKIAAWL